MPKANTIGKIAIPAIPAKSVSPAATAPAGGVFGRLGAGEAGGYNSPALTDYSSDWIDRMLRSISFVAALYLFWILMSGFFTPFLLAAGLGSALVVAWLAHRMQVFDREGHPFHLTWAALTYWPWLIKEIMKSSFDIARIIVDPRLPVSPTVVRFRPRQKTTVGLVTHANSITLTPGTLSIEVAPDRFMVHALTREGAAATAVSEMDRRVERFEGST